MGRSVSHRHPPSAFIRQFLEGSFSEVRRSKAVEISIRTRVPGRDFLRARARFERPLAPIVARNRGKRLRLDTSELPENFLRIIRFYEWFLFL